MDTLAIPEELPVVSSARGSMKETRKPDNGYRKSSAVNESHNKL
jgi:hypothetical protein